MSGMIVSAVRSQRGALLSVLLLAVSAQIARADALTFFNHWFVTGGHAVAGAGFANTNGSSVINMSGVPCTTGPGLSASMVACNTPGAVPATPVAAFLYWQQVENTATATAPNGIFNGFPIVGNLLGSDASSGCWLAAPNQTLRSYRADVLRDVPIDPVSHIRLANGAHTVKLGNLVSGNSGVLPAGILGASLVVIYRVVAPGNPALAPLRSVVIYDGAYTLRNGQPSMTQKIFGFYQASTNPAGVMTHIVGNGQTSFRETLKVEGAVPAGVSSTQPFVGAQGGRWDNLTFGIDLKQNDSSTETKTVIAGNASDCLTWSSVVTAANVQDSDNDGIVDFWEKNGFHRNTLSNPATFGGCADFPLEACVNLPAMGAKNGVQDIFLQMDWMHGYGDGTGGIDGTGLHSHIPKLQALTAVANAFSAHKIAVHFDVGNNYQGMGLPYIIPFTKDAYGNQLAQGGADIDEATLVCHDTPKHACDYHEPYPVVSFKFGFGSIRDGNPFLNIPRHFAQDRLGLFHYVLWAHALGGPYDTATGKALFANPKTTSGIGDRPGGDLMITLGLWRSDIPANDQVGSSLVQGGTLLHELGHNLDLSHGGWSSTPNCMPDYPSVMSYLYQTRGLTDANGIAQIDYSNGLLAALNENSLSTGIPLGPLQYRVRYYAPFNPAINSAGQAAKVHCDGTPITDGALQVRLEGAGLTTPDWSNGTNPFILPMDVNFDGISGQTLSDQKDWISLDLKQLGSRTNFGTLSGGGFYTDTGGFFTDPGGFFTDPGGFFTDPGGFFTDPGGFFTDPGGFFTDPGGYFTDNGNFATDPGQDEDYDSHIRSTTDRIPSAQQCAGCGLKATNGLAGITLSWTPPETGGRLTYNIYRCAGAGCTPTPPALITGVVPASPTAPTVVDIVNDTDPFHAGATCPAGNTCYNTAYTYSATAVSTALVESPYSDTASSAVTHLFVVADNQTVVYGSPNPTPTFKIYGDVAGSLTAALVTCAYPGVPRNAGSYPITCTGPATTSTTDGVTYNARYLTYTPGTLTISPRPITVAAVSSNKVYDGTTASAGTPSITLGTLAYSDTVTWTQSYASRNAVTQTLNAAGAVNDGNAGNNYAVTFVPATGTISPRPITVTAAASSKVYDGTTASKATPTITSGNLISPDSVTWTESYDNKNAGSAHVMTPTGTVSDGNGGNNYAVTFVTISTGVILQANAIIVVSPYSVTFDGKPHTATGTATGVLGESLSGLNLSATTHTDSGSYTDTWTFTDPTGNYKHASGTIVDVIARAAPAI